MSGTALYHYTNAQGLRGIVSNQTLWATHYRFLNDTSEGFALEQHLVAVFDQEIKSLALEKSKDKSFSAHSKKTVIAALAAENGKHREILAKALFNSMIRAADDIAPFFVISFCTHAEAELAANGILSQWRGYGEDGGYCVVFDQDLIVKDIKEDTLRRKLGIVKFGNVTYSEALKESDKQLIKGIAQKFVERALDGSTTVTPVPDEELKDQITNAIFGVLPFYKHPAFAEEGEFRIVICGINSIVGNKLEGMIEPYLFRERHGYLVPYIELFKGRQKALPIRKLLVGPGRNKERRTKGARVLISSSHPDILVEESKIPFVS
jgi:Protein of unknown function (DUF2971)